MDKFYLSFDASTPRLSIALKKNSTVLDCISSEPYQQSEAISEILDSLLSRNKIKLSDVSQIYCASGPGSFTGLRTAISFIKGLEKSTRLSVGYISNLVILCFLEPGPKECFSLAIKANKDEYFFAEYAFDLEAKRVTEVISPRVVTKDKLGELRVDLIFDTYDSELAAKALFKAAEFKADLISEPQYLKEVNAKTIKERQQKA